MADRRRDGGEVRDTSFLFFLFEGDSPNSVE